MSKIKSFAGLVITFGIAFGCDLWVESLRRNLTLNSDISAFLWQAGIANLLLAIVLLLLTWYVLFWAKRSKLVSALFLLIGLVITFISALEISLAGTLPPLGIVEFLTPNSHVLYAAALVAILGLAGFLLPTRTTNKNRT